MGSTLEYDLILKKVLHGEIEIFEAQKARNKEIYSGPRKLDNMLR